jgi:hypothetical protein
LKGGFVHFLKLAAVTALTMVAFTACGGSTATPAGAGATTPATAAATAAASVAATTGAASSAAATTAASQGPTAALCSLLTPAELNAATGKTYEAGVPDTTGGCTWNVGKSQANSGSLIVAAVQEADLATIKGMFAGGVDTTVAGKAGYWNGKQGLQTMWVDLGGGRLFTLGFPRSEDLGPADQAIAQALAELAVGKM